MSTLSRILALPPVARLILVFQLLINAGSFMVIPYLAVYVVKDIGLSVAFAGIVLTVKSACQRGLILYGGYLADRHGEFVAIVLGNLLRIASYLGLAMFTQDAGLLVSAALLGGSAALFIPASKSVLAKVVSDDQLHFAYATRNVFNNLGVAAGGILGGVLMRLSPTMIFLAAAAIQAMVLAFFVVAARGATRSRPEAARPRPAAPAYSFGAALREILRSRAFLAMSLVNVVFYAIYMQLELTLPLHANQQYGTAASGLIFTINAVVIIALQLPLTQWLARRLSEHAMLAAGFAIVAASFAGFAGLPGPLWFGLVIAVYTIGEMIIDPTIDAAANRSIPRAYAGTVFGMLGLTALLGSLLGGTLGGEYYARLASKSLYWGGYAALSLAACVVLGWAARRRHPAFSRQSDRAV
ncbi:MFS transporter [Burkholderia glumae]|uniref:MFS transporter n=1 Tax=Burkholderia glumae TaxID=337 RepID=UPI000F5DDDF7|nr:MFS transporter [Burkholderia glumae]MCQ0033485.1 MFS transporter [Burkholderia glumae]MCQ0037982.1 MFS transporter [Burkholderia glumae]QJW80471.1 MFS transporter [Burkholderia glumae]RQZ67363.1 MFS transporter [Burkholderia glumae]UVS93204.1 MFS transporter [Burkholderia glumae]